MQPNKDIAEDASDRKSLGRDPERSKRILVDATLDTLAEEGLSETTVSRIITRAGVSRGMIHLHFGGKDNLVGAAAKVFAQRYYDEIERQLDGIADDPVETIMAVVHADLSAQLLNEKSIAIWHALRGAARYNATIARFSDTRDRRLRNMIRDGFAGLIDDPKTEEAHALTRDATLGTLALLEGMWADFMAHPTSFNRVSAERIVRRFLAGLFPGRF